MAIRDDNFDSFVDNWDRFKGRLVLFLGAGASVGALNALGDPLPNAYQLRNRLWQEFKVRKGSAFDPKELGLMSLEHAASIIEASSGREELNSFLVHTFSCGRLLWQHVALPHLGPSCIFTTNYDELVELGYKQHRVVLDIICEDRSPVNGRFVLFKPHGSLWRSNMAAGKGGLVITQFYYFEMIADYRKMLSRAMSGFGKSCVILVGYSFGDMDIGAELFRIRKQNNGTPWYAVFPRNDPQVRLMYSNRLDIRQINATLESFLTELDSKVSFISDVQHKHARRNNLRTKGVIQ